MAPGTRAEFDELAERIRPAGPVAPPLRAIGTVTGVLMRVNLLPRAPIAGGGVAVVGRHTVAWFAPPAIAP